MTSGHSLSPGKFLPRLDTKARDLNCRLFRYYLRDNLSLMIIQDIQTAKYKSGTLAMRCMHGTYAMLIVPIYTIYILKTLTNSNKKECELCTMFRLHSYYQREHKNKLRLKLVKSKVLRNQFCRKEHFISM